MTAVTPISNYADDMLVGIPDTGMTDDLWQLAYDDAGRLGKLSVRSDRERNLLFHLENFIDDLCKEFGYSESENRDKIVSMVFNMLRNKKDVGLADIREAVFWILESIAVRKVAYPNITGVNETNRRSPRDVNKWVKALGDLRVMMQAGYEKDVSAEQVLEGWDPMEKLDFEAWARYYEKGDHEKYQIRQAAAAPLPFQMPQGQVGVPAVPQPPKDKLGPGRPRQTERTPESIRKAFISRLNSAEKLLYDYKEVWPASVLGKLYEYLAELKRMIFTLETKASMVDCIYRTAGQWDRSGFSEGATYLRKIAQEPGGDIASQIEKALTGREYETKEETPPPAEGMPPMPSLGEADMPPPGTTDMPPPAEGEVGMSPPPEGAPLAGAGEELPPMPPPPPMPEPEEPKGQKDNPFAGSTVQDVLEILEPMVQRLKAREEFRELSRVDMMLDALNIASHFPELTEAVSHLLETNNYVVIRLDKIVGKLKGGLKEEDAGEKKPTEKPATGIEMGELGGAAPKEKEMFEVTEGETPPPGPGFITPPAPPPPTGA